MTKLAYSTGGKQGNLMAVGNEEWLLAFGSLSKVYITFSRVICNFPGSL